MRRRGVCVLVFCLLVLGAVPALAAEGRTPVYQPTGLNVSGKYVVTRSFVGNIAIAAPDVDLDLNGFTVTAPAGLPVILITSPADHVVIRNGILAGGISCIDAPVGLPTSVRKVVIEDVQCHDTMGDGIHLGDVASANIRRTNVTAAMGAGINWNGGPVKNGSIEHTVVRQAQMGIYVLNASSLTVSYNTIETMTGAVPFSGYGIFIDQSQGVLVSENTVEAATADGIFFRTTYASKIFDNVVEKSAFHGVHLNPASFNNLVLKNNSSNNGTSGPQSGCGLFVESVGSLIEGNILNGNSNYGLLFTGCGNGFGRNMARGNAGPNVVCPGNPPLTPPESCNQAVQCVPYGNTSSQQNLIPNLF